eukprot:superscaffoldBa00004878_g19575
MGLVFPSYAPSVRGIHTLTVRPSHNYFLWFTVVGHCHPPKPFRRVTFSVVSQPQDPHQQGSLQSCYDSGLDESETPSSKSSSGPRLGALPLPEDSYERTTPDGSVGEAEHMENGRGKH